MTHSSDAFLATMRLRMFAMRHSTRVMDYGYVYDAIQKYRNFGPTGSCDRQYVSFLFNQMLDYQLAVMEIPGRAQSMGNESSGQQRSFRESPANLEQVKSLVMMTAARPSAVYARCRDDEYYDMTLMAGIHGVLLIDKGKEAAAKFRKELERRSMSREELVSYYLEAAQLNATDVVRFYFAEGREANIGGGTAGTVLGRLSSPKPHAVYPLYRWLVDSGDVCNSARLLFRIISKTERFNEAISYMINNLQIDAASAAKCGDAELELLLKP